MESTEDEEFPLTYNIQKLLDTVKDDLGLDDTVSDGLVIFLGLSLTKALIQDAKDRDGD